MDTLYIPPTFDELVRTQEVVQADKHRKDLLSHYEQYVFNDYNLDQTNTCAVTDFILEHCLEGTPSIEAIIAKRQQEVPDRPIHWVDMGGGLGLPMRQAAVDWDPDRRSSHMTNVDLLECGFELLDEKEMEFLHAISPGAAEDSSQPKFVRADHQAVKLDEPADLITAIETIQYADDPLRALCSWYNQLHDGGIMVVASIAPEWASGFQYHNLEGRHAVSSPMMDVVEVLGASAIAFAATHELDVRGFRPKLKPTLIHTLAFEKQPGTTMNLNARVKTVDTRHRGYKSTRYVLDGASNPIGVENQNADYQAQTVAEPALALAG